MSSTNKTSLGLNMWEASDKPVRQDFVKDNVIIDDEVTKLKQDIGSKNTVINEKINKLNSNLSNDNILNGTNCYVRYSGATLIISVTATGITLIGGNSINSNVFSLPPNVHLKLDIYDSLCLLDQNWTPFVTANNCFVSIGSNGVINVRCSRDVNNAVLVGNIVLPRSSVSIT